MSLKAFHSFFIVAATLLAFGFGAWALGEYQRTHAGGMLAFAALGLVSGGALIAYELWFLRKLKGVEP